MMYRFSPFLLAMLLISCGRSQDVVPESDSTKVVVPDTTVSTEKGSDSSPRARYEVASGSYQMTVSTVPGMTRTIYFIDSGAVQATYTEVPMKPGETARTVDIVKEGWRTSYDVSEKIGTRMRLPETIMAGYLPNPRTMAEEMKQKYDYHEVGTKQILGKEANGFSLTIGGMKMTEWEWKGIPLRLETDMGTGKPVIAEVTNLEVDVPVPAEKFQVPQNVKITEQHVPGQPMSLPKE